MPIPGYAAKVAVLQKRRHRRRRRSAFNALVADPFDLGTAAAGDPLPESFPLPARSRLAVSIDEETEDGDVVVTVGTHSYPKPAGAADVVHRLPVGERGQLVSVSSDSGAPAGSVTVYVLDEHKKYETIATGIIS